MQELIDSNDKLRRDYTRERIYYKSNANGSDNNTPHLENDDKTSENEDSIYKTYTLEELKEMAKDNESIIDEYVDRPTKWNGEITIEESKKNQGAHMNKDNSFTINGPTSKMVTLHEQLHARSWSYLSEEERKEYGVSETMQSIEEGSVQLLAEEISKAEGIEIVPSAYDEDVGILRELNSLGGLYDNDLDFAKELFKHDLTGRADWLEDTVRDNLMKKAGVTTDDMIKFDKLIRKIRKEEQ